MVKSYPKNKPTRLKGKAIEELRRQCFERDKGICQTCGFYAPLEGFWTERGHMAHERHRSVGGADVLDNVKWRYPRCHLGLRHTKGIK